MDAGLHHSEAVPDSVQSYVKHSIASITNDISKVLEDRFANLKRELAADNSQSLQSVAKKIRAESHDFKSKGNKQQYDHQVTVIGHMEQAKAALERCDLEEAKAALQDGIKDANDRCKLILLADKSEHGWSTVSEYITDELAENSEDEKRIHKAEKVAERKAAKRKKDKRPLPKDIPKLPIRPNFPYALGRALPAPSGLGPCFKISIIATLTFVLTYRAFFPARTSFDHFPRVM